MRRDHVLHQRLSDGTALVGSGQQHHPAQTLRLAPGQVLTHHQGSYRVGHQMDPLSRIHFRRIQVYIGHWPQRIPVSHANPVRPPSSFCYLDRMA